MDIFNEIYRLPNVEYAFLGDNCKEDIAILGEYSALKEEIYEYSPNILHTSDKMRTIYSQTELSVDDKTELATLMKKMYSACEMRKA